MRPARLAITLAAASFLLATGPLSQTARASEIQVDILSTGVGIDVIFYGVSWRGDGSEALIVGDGPTALRYWHASGGFKRIDASGSAPFLLDCAWRPDSAYALVSGSSGSLFAFNGLSLVPYDTGVKESLYSVSWRRDSAEALIVGSNGTVLRFRDGSIERVPSGTTAALFDCSYRRDGSALIVGEGGTALIWVAGGGLRPLETNTSHGLLCVAWSPDGSLALVAGNRGTIATFDGEAFSHVLRDMDYTFLGCCWSPDGSSALICGDTGMILKYRSGRLSWIETGLGSPLQDIEYRPQGGEALSVGNKARVVRYPRAGEEPGACLVASPLLAPTALAVCGGAVLLYLLIAHPRRPASGGAPGFSRERRGRRRRSR
ncbi:MAG: WD40 repeat domain-containing protein [Thermoplasmatota archaeon]